jgi:glycosyltransferase involved in cell wall biosynthesis
MLLLDAIYINNGGGKILLDYLIEEFEKNKLTVHYLLDERIRNNHPAIKINKVTYLEGSILKRHQFYLKNKKSFTKVLCFGNLGPSLKLKAEVFTYFHQKLFLDVPKDIPFKQKVVFKIKTIIFKTLNKNVDFWIVQTKAMKDIFIEKLSNIDEEKILTIPFYPSLNKCNFENRKRDSFIYVSSGSPHKNHLNLLQAFRIFYNSNKVGELHLTIGDESIELNTTISKMITEGYPIVNHGFVSRDSLGEIYRKASFSVYPSLSESFGLGIIEAIENGCDIIGSDLPFIYAVCKPSLVFDPTNPESIAIAFQAALKKHLTPTEQLVFNEIDTLIKLLQDNENPKENPSHHRRNRLLRNCSP